MLFLGVSSLVQTEVSESFKVKHKIQTAREKHKGTTRHALPKILRHEAGDIMRLRIHQRWRRWRRWLRDSRVCRSCTEVNRSVGSSGRGVTCPLAPADMDREEKRGRERERGL
ncbi:hypothetical protein SKAU_G00113770 [Synaphobranchus kaupii]|uniref:Uncharacterized protein n=1 Tax=Synaphobranchus kaupii TaxID=118154 RepID=A0A9Q1G0P4_SYNKA|nr:hypothetical protein SKAU_G00113770 [Synaphobranchus kaupii]